jgi:hypothetical protein
MTLEEWVERHRLEGHHPHPPTDENPERRDCECGYIWRILTGEQIRMKFAHLKHRPRSANPDLPVPSTPPSGPPLRVAARYAAGRPRAPRRD